MVTIAPRGELAAMLPLVQRLFEHSAHKIRLLQQRWDPARGTPVFTVKGLYTARGWTEWTQGFQFGSSLLQFDATGEKRFLDLGREATLQLMASHVSHTGVHDHGFNNVSTYGNLLRLMTEERIPAKAPRARSPQISGSIFSLPRNRARISATVRISGSLS